MELREFLEIANAVPSDFTISVEDSYNQVKIRRVLVDFSSNEIIIQITEE